MDGGKSMEKFGIGAVIAAWVIGTLATLGFWAVVVWAIIKVVGAITS